MAPVSGESSYQMQPASPEGKKAGVGAGVRDARQAGVRVCFRPLVGDGDEHEASAEGGERQLLDAPAQVLHLVGRAG